MDLPLALLQYRNHSYGIESEILFSQKFYMKRKNYTSVSEELWY